MTHASAFRNKCSHAAEEYSENIETEEVETIPHHNKAKHVMIPEESKTLPIIETILLATTYDVLSTAFIMKFKGSMRTRCTL